MGRKEAHSPGGVTGRVQAVGPTDLVTRSIEGWCWVCSLPLEAKSSGNAVGATGVSRKRVNLKMYTCWRDDGCRDISNSQAANSTDLSCNGGCSSSSWTHPTDNSSTTNPTPSAPTDAFHCELQGGLPSQPSRRRLGGSTDVGQFIVL